MAFVEASSSRGSPTPYRPPDIERSKSEESQINDTLASRRRARRRSFLHPGHHRDVKRASPKSRKQDLDSDDETEEEWVEQDRAEGSGPKLAQKVWRGLKRDKIAGGPNGEDAAVHLYVKGRGTSSREEVFDLMAREDEERERASKKMQEIREDVQAEYVWDVLFENQRGILLLGRPFFSSSTLLPFDPSSFTVPSKQLPSATSSFTVSDPEGTRQARSPSPKGKEKASERIRPTKTAYTPATFQTPSPAWTYLTPWLINMRSDGDTDELGWEYNHIFRTKGWHARVGRIGWGGWVRRRGWVRLRSRVLPKQAQEPHDGDPTDTDAAVKEELDVKAEETENQTHMPTPEEHAATEKGDLLSAREAIDMGDDAGELDILHDVRKAVASLTVDRQKLALWSKWLSEAEGDGEVRRKLALVCGAGARDEIYQDIEQQFVYTQSRKSLAHMLDEAGLRKMASSAERDL